MLIKPLFAPFWTTLINIFVFRQPKKANWPVSENMEVPVHKRGKLIGPGGMNLKKIMVETGAQVPTSLN